MCAAKLERTGFVLRSVWPNVKHFANEQSATFAQSANESGFVRKNSQKADAAASGGARCPRPLEVFAARKCQPPRSRLSSRLPTPGVLNAGHQYRHISVPACSAGTSSSSSAVALLADALGDAPSLRADRLRSGVSIDELIQTASEKYELNKDFWGKYADIPSMAQATGKEDVLQIIENFVLIHRKHVYLFQRLKNTVLKNLDMWSAPDFAALCHAWAQLGFLHEDLCVAMAARVTLTAYTCNTQELCWLMDAYATARCSVQSVVDELTRQTILRLDEFTPSQLCLHASSFARLNVRHEGLFDSIADCLAQASDEGSLSARDLTLAAYSFAKLGFCFPRVFDIVSRSALDVVRDFTARDLQMLTVALVRAQHRDPELLEALSLQAQRRIAQFSSESLTLMLRSMAFFGVRDSNLFTRAVVQLPRAIQNFRPADVTTLLNTFAAVQVHSTALFDIVTPFVLEKAPMFTPADWLGTLRGYSMLGNRDAVFLSALGLHLQASKLTVQQLSAAMVDCSRLSFSGSSASLAKAVLWKVEVEGVTFPADAAAQMYSALLLLGHSTAATGGADEAAQRLLRVLALDLRTSDIRGALSPASRVNLCYAMLLAPPVAGGEGKHPMDALALAERCAGHALDLPAEGQLLLRLIMRALKLLPWNRCALRSVERLEAAAPASLNVDISDPEPQYVLAAASHLSPHFGELTLQGAGIAPAFGAGSFANVGSPHTAVARHRGVRQGIFMAWDIREGLQAISAALAATGINHQLVSNPEAEPHIILPRGVLPGRPVTSAAADDRRDVALLWGSTVHYISDGVEQTLPRLSPTARLQVAALQALQGAEVVVIPYWRWPGSWTFEERGAALIQVILDEMVAEKVPSISLQDAMPSSAGTWPGPPPGLELDCRIGPPPGLTPQYQ